MSIKPSFELQEQRFPKETRVTGSGRHPNTCFPYMLVNAILQLQEQYKDHNNSTSTNKNIISEWYTYFLSVCARFSLLGVIVSAVLAGR